MQTMTYTNDTATAGKTEHAIRDDLGNHENGHQLPAQSLILDLVGFFIPKDITFAGEMAVS
jgi:hypothetical protein